MPEQIAKSSSAFFALVKKDFTEVLRNSQMIVFVIFCAFFGILSPLSARYLPDILAMVGETQNIVIILPEVSYSDVIMQYVKNFTQIGPMVIIFICMGGIAKEKDQGTMAFILVKPVSRSAIVFSKFVIQGILMIVGTIAAMILTAIYTSILFGTFPLIDFILANLLLLCFFLTIMGITLGLSAIFEKPMVAGVSALGVWMVMAIFGSIPRIGLFSFTKLGEQFQLVSEGFSFHWQPVFGAVVLTLIFMLIGMRKFAHWEPLD